MKDGQRIRLINNIHEYRRDGTLIPSGTEGEVVRADMFGGHYVQVRLDDEPFLIRLVEREKLEAI